MWNMKRSKLSKYEILLIKFLNLAREVERLTDMKTDIGFPNMKTLKEAIKIYHGLNDKTKI